MVRSLVPSLIRSGVLKASEMPALKLSAAALVLFLGSLSYAQQPASATPASTPASNPEAQQTPPPSAATPVQSEPAVPAMGLDGAQKALATPPAAAAPADPALLVPAGTKVLLSVESAVNTKTAKQGDGIYLVSTFPVIVGSHVLIPSGVYVQGVVDQVTRPGRVKGRAKLLMHFTTMIFPNGQVVSIPGGVNNLPGSTGPTVKNSEGEIEQAGNKGRDAGDIAKGAGAGTGIGSIAGAAAGHPIEGLAYGALGGAAAGALYTLFTRGDDITIPTGTSIEMVLQRPLQLEPAQLAGINDTQGRPQFVPSAAQQQPLPKPRLAMTCPPGALGCY